MIINHNNPSDCRSYPASWERIKCGRLFREISDRSETGNEELLSVSHITGITPRSQKNVTMFQAESLVGYKVCQKGDIVANTMWTWQGAIGVSDYDGVVSPAYNVYRQKESFYNDRYLDFLLREKTLVDVYHSLSTGIRKSRLRLYPGQFFTIDLPVPPMNEQEKIVQYLDWQVSKINKLIKSERNKLELLKELLITLYHRIVASSSEKIRMKRSFSLVNDYIQIDNEKNYRKAGMYNRGRGIFLRDPVEGADMGKSTFQAMHKDCLMISGQFAWEDAVYITSLADEEGVASHRYYLLKAERPDIPVEYLWAYFIAPEGFHSLVQCSHGAAGRNRPLNIDELLRTNIVVPNDDKAMTVLVNAVRNYMELQKKIAQKEAVLQEYRSKMISDIITGKIDVQDVEIPEYEFVADVTEISDDDDSDEAIDGEED